MPKGGPQPGSGPKPGSTRIAAKLQVAARLRAESEGFLLPHELLLRAANGQSFKVRKLHIIYYARGPKRGEEKERKWVEEDYYPTFEEQLDAAKAAAPYYAPRLMSQTVNPGENTANALTEVMKQLSTKLPG